MSESVTIKIDGDNKEYKQSLKDVDKANKDLGKSSLKTATQVTAVSAAVFAVGKSLQAVISQAAKMEDFAVQFEVLTGSASRARRVLGDLQDFAAGTPFKFESIANAGKLLLAFGFEADEVKDRLREIGDVSAATGQDLSAIAQIYGQVTAAGKLTGERLNQLTERSINVAPAIAELFGVQETEVRKLVSQGVVSAEIFKKAFASMSAEGGIAFQGLEKKSQTLNGKLSTMSDNWDLLITRLGNRFLPIAKKATDALTGLIQAATPEGAPKTLKEVDEQIQNINKSLEKFGEKSKTFSRFGIGTGTGRDQGKRRAELEALKKLRVKFAKEEAEEAELAKKEATKKSADEAIELEKEKAQKIAAAGREAFINAERDKIEARRVSLESNAEADGIELEQAQLKMEEMALLRQEEDLLKLEEAEKLKEAQRKIEEEKLQDAKKYAEARIKTEQGLSQARIGIARSTAELITTLFGEENKAAFLIAKGAAFAQAALDYQKANMGSLAASRSLPPVTSEAYLGKSLALNKIQFGLSSAIIGAQAIQGLETGGVVGGFTGATTGPDNVNINARKGEMYLNAGQQRELFDKINSGTIGDKEGGQEIEISLTMSENLIDFVEAGIIQKRAIGTSEI
jgi:tape measure domain-containing protein